MKRPISPRTHGIIDYTTVALTAAAPRLLDFPPSATMVCETLAGGYLGVSLLTDYPLGAKRVIPFKAHGITEGVIGAALPALPWMLGFAKHTAARNFMLGLTAVTAVVSALTDWNAEIETPRTRRSRRAGTSGQRRTLPTASSNGRLDGVGDRDRATAGAR